MITKNTSPTTNIPSTANTPLPKPLTITERAAIGAMTGLASSPLFNFFNNCISVISNYYATHNTPAVSKSPSAIIRGDIKEKGIRKFLVDGFRPSAVKLSLRTGYRNLLLEKTEGQNPFIRAMVLGLTDVALLGPLEHGATREATSNGKYTFTLRSYFALPNRVKAKGVPALIFKYPGATWLPFCFLDQPLSSEYRSMTGNTSATTGEVVCKATTLAAIDLLAGTAPEYMRASVQRYCPSEHGEIVTTSAANTHPGSVSFSGALTSARRVAAQSMKIAGPKFAINTIGACAVLGGREIARAYENNQQVRGIC